jgi:hypothetical protein
MEKTIREESGIGWGFKSGQLILTDKNLYFIRKGEKIVSIFLGSITSIKCDRWDNASYLSVYYLINGKEEKVKFNHNKLMDYLVLGKLGKLAQLKDSYFIDWMKSINDARFNKDERRTDHYSVADELKKLNELLEEGVISQSDFDSQKEKLLKITL